jgi:hypothetical protein
MMVKATNCHLVIDPFLAFYQCLLLDTKPITLITEPLLEEPRMCQGYPGMVYTFEPYYIHL